MTEITFYKKVELTDIKKNMIMLQSTVTMVVDEFNYKCDDYP